MYTHVYVCTCICVSVYLYASVCVHVCLSVHACVCVCMCLCACVIQVQMCVHMYLCVHSCEWVCLCVHMCACMHTCICMPWHVCEVRGQHWGLFPLQVLGTELRSSVLHSRCLQPLSHLACPCQTTKEQTTKKKYSKLFSGMKFGMILISVFFSFVSLLFPYRVVLLCSTGQPQIYEPPASTFQALG